MRWFSMLNDFVSLCEKNVSETIEVYYGYQQLDRPSRLA